MMAMSDWIEIKEGNPIPELVLSEGRLSDDVLVWTSDGHCTTGFAFQKFKGEKVEFVPRRCHALDAATEGA